jgi:succinate dehydrogenase membrane anchor subunit
MATQGMRSPLGRARGLGSAKEGVAHWWRQRVSALALIPLALWFVSQILAHVGAGIDAAQSWIGRPLPAVLLVLTLIATFYHAALGLEVVIEDYVETAFLKFGLVVFVRLVAIALAVAGIFAVLRSAL